MWNFNDKLGHDVICHASEAGGAHIRAPECIGLILAGDPHYNWRGASLGLPGLSDDDPRNAVRYCRSCVRRMNWSTTYERKDKILVKVELTYHDGSKSVLDGEAADDWDSAAASTSVMSSIHGVSFPALPWKKIDPPK